MAYAVTNPPVRMSEYPLTSFGNSQGAGGAIWVYKSTDAATTVRVAGYITNAAKLGMQVGDSVFVHDTDAAPYTVTWHIVTAINATTGAADLSDAAATASTNSD
jgi:hypothetical protein